MGAQGQPDFAKVTIELDIRSKGKCPELKSVKKYFSQFRDVVMSYERATILIKDHFLEVYDPRTVDIVLKFQARGGLESTICK